MDIKKRPPPGATLISRLREGRLKREQALAEKREQQSGAASPAQAEPEAVVEAEPIVEVKPLPPEKPRVEAAYEPTAAKKSAGKSGSKKKEAGGDEPATDTSTQTVQVTVEVAAVEAIPAAPSPR